MEISWNPRRKVDYFLFLFPEWWYESRIRMGSNWVLLCLIKLHLRICFDIFKVHPEERPFWDIEKALICGLDIVQFFFPLSSKSTRANFPFSEIDTGSTKLTRALFNENWHGDSVTSTITIGKSLTRVLSDWHGNFTLMLRWNCLLSLGKTVGVY